MRLAEHVHGHLGWLAAVALVHPAIVLRKPKRRAHLAVGTSVALVTIAAALGASTYPAYTSRIKQQIFLHAPAMGYLFERKEHLAVGAVLLAWAGAIAYVAARAKGDELLARFAARAYAIAAALAFAAAALGTWVATYRSF